MRAAELAGPNWFVEILPDGTIRLAQLREPPIIAPPRVEPAEEIRLW